MEENNNEKINEEVKAEEVKGEETKKENITEEKVEAVKNEAKETIKEVKEQMKDVDFKEEAKATRGFVKSMIKEPIEQMKQISTDSSNKFFKTALVILIVWTIIYFFSAVSFTSLKYMTFLPGLWMIVRGIITPAIAVAVFSLIIFLLNLKSENKKSLITIITSVVTAKLPIVIAALFSLLTLISSEAYKITSRVSSIASVLSAILLYFAVKGIFNAEDDKKAFIKFTIVYAIYMAVSLVLSFIQISI